MRIIVACILFFLLTVFLSGCYSEKKAQVQFGKAAATFPAIAANYCATTYPVKETIIKGKDSITTDTLWSADQTFFDTVYMPGKPVEVVKTIILPGKTIREKSIRIDTIIKENTAALQTCNLEKNKLTDLLTTAAADLQKWKGKAKKRFWIIAGIGSLLLIGLILKLRKKINPL